MLAAFHSILMKVKGSFGLGVAQPHTRCQSTRSFFGFGSGDFVKGSEAHDVMTADGRWLRYVMESADALIILEKQRKTPDHLESATFFNKAQH